jgi:periplasmic iron binding protein
VIRSYDLVTEALWTEARRWRFRTEGRAVLSGAIAYTIEKAGSGWKTSGTLRPMVGKGGLHYADNVKMDAPGPYNVAYHFTSPAANGFRRHADKEIGVPAWWPPFDETFTFRYPQE